VNTTLRVNGTTHELSIDSRLTLLDTLREVLGLVGTKKGCDQGSCGAELATPRTAPRRTRYNGELSSPNDPMNGVSTTGR